MSEAKDWVEYKFPTVSGNEKARLILAYGVGLNAGMLEAERLVEAVAAELINRTAPTAAREG